MGRPHDRVHRADGGEGAAGSHRLRRHDRRRRAVRPDHRSRRHHLPGGSWAARDRRGGPGDRYFLGVQNTGTGVFPPAGWTWLGWGYNGSTALFEWEQQLARNGSQIGSVKSGQLRSFADSLPLFEGFVAEIQTKGYVIGDAGMYVFRCTASTRKDCAGLTRSSLSNHAYGLALDFNTAKNPLKTYYGVNGAGLPDTHAHRRTPMGRSGRREVGALLGRLRMEQWLLVAVAGEVVSQPRPHALRIQRHGCTSAPSWRSTPLAAAAARSSHRPVRSPHRRHLVASASWSPTPRAPSPPAATARRRCPVPTPE